MKWITYIALGAAIMAASGFWNVVSHRRDRTIAHGRVIAKAMGWRRGDTVAEIGAGDGRLSDLAAHEVGFDGHVFATETDPASLVKLNAGLGKNGLRNVQVIAGAEDSTNLPDDCCEAIFMRLVYHHFTKPAQMNRSLFRAVRPNGLLAVADYYPSAMWRLAAAVRGRPVDGIPPEFVVRDVTAAGFMLDGEVASWPGEGYCLLFRKPDDGTP